MNTSATHAGRLSVLCQMTSGKVVDLANPTPDKVHWPDLVENLAKIPRFNGATPCVTLTMAQHCCHAYDFALDDHKAVALLTPFYKAYVGELTSPAKDLLILSAPDPEVARQTFALTQKRLTNAIFAAADVSVPSDRQEHAETRFYLTSLRRKLLATERRDFLADCATPDHWNLPAPFPQRLKAWPQDKSITELCKRLAAIGIEGRH